MTEQSEATDKHPPVEDMVAYVRGSLDRAGHTRVEQHLAVCRLCANEIGDLVRLTGRNATWRRRIPMIAGAAGLAAAVALMVLVHPRPEAPDTRHRAPEQSSAALIEAISPRGGITKPVTLIWSSLGHGAYRVTVFDAEGTILYQGDASDSVLMLPDSIRFVTGRSYFWKVESDTGWNRWVSSRLSEFSVSPDSIPGR